MVDSLYIFILVVLGSALLYLIKLAITEGKAKAELIESDLARSITLTFYEAVERVVASLNQTIVEPLKNSPELNFDKEAQRKVLEEAKKAIKKDLDNQSLEVLKKTHSDFEAFLEDSIEAEVGRQKYK